MNRKKQAAPGGDGVPWTGCFRQVCQVGIVQKPALPGGGEPSTAG